MSKRHGESSVSIGNASRGKEEQSRPGFFNSSLRTWNAKNSPRREKLEKNGRPPFFFLRQGRATQAQICKEKFQEGTKKGLDAGFLPPLKKRGTKEGGEEVKFFGF